MNTGIGWFARPDSRRVDRSPRLGPCEYELGCGEPSMVIAPDRLYVKRVPCCARHGLGGGSGAPADR